MAPSLAILLGPLDVADCNTLATLLLKHVLANPLSASWSVTDGLLNALRALLPGEDWVTGGERVKLLHVAYKKHADELFPGMPIPHGELYGGIGSQPWPAELLRIVGRSLAELDGVDWRAQVGAQASDAIDSACTHLSFGDPFSLD